MPTHAIHAALYPSFLLFAQMGGGGGGERYEQDNRTDSRTVLSTHTFSNPPTNPKTITSQHHPKLTRTGVHARHSIVFTPRGRVYALVGVLVSRRTRTRISPKANPTRPRPHGDIFRTFTGGTTYADLKDRPSALTAGRKAGHTSKLRFPLRHTMDKTRTRVDSFKSTQGRVARPLTRDNVC